MFKRNKVLFLSLAGLIVLGVLVYQIPAVQIRLDWRITRITAYVNGVINPAGPVPTALPTSTPPPGQIEASPTATLPPTPVASLTPTPTLQPLPAQASLPAPEFEDEKKFPNNCGPATLTMYLRMYGWTGDQFTISNVIKPKPDDRNVNPDELTWWVQHNAGWLQAEYRVDGNVTLLKQLLAGGFPVMIEETFIFDAPYWPNDDLWAAHYVLLTGYDDSTGNFTVQDAFHGPNMSVSYEKLEKDWEPFNHLYLLLFLPNQAGQLQDILGPNWDADTNRQIALKDTQAATASNPNDAFAWFNYGSNLVYFDRYNDALAAYDTARKLGLPQRMMRYQFGPFIADFQTNQIDDLLAITQDTLNKASYKWSEEAWLWRGYALLRKGDLAGASNAWNTAISVHPAYCDAEYAINNYIKPTYSLDACIP